MPQAAKPLPPDAPPGSKPAQILEAAGRLFTRQGFGATSMDAVAREAGVSKATLYAHFSGKEALFSAIVSRECRKQERLFEATEATDGDIRESLAEIGRSFLGLLLSTRTVGIYRVVVAETPRFPELGRAFFESGHELVRDRIAAFLAKAAVHGRVEVDDARMAADHLVGMLMAPVHSRRVLGVMEQPTGDEMEPVVRSAVDAFLRAYGPRP